MKNKKLKNILIILGTGAILLGATIVSSEPGSEKDPLVSLSYLEDRLEELEEAIDTKLSGIDDSGKDETQASNFEIVEITAGQSIIGKDGTEIILRGGTGNGPGRARIIARGTDGLSDITIGKDLKSGEEVPLNHMLIVPRDDGRGVLALSDSVYLVKGEYEIR